MSRVNPFNFTKSWRKTDDLPYFPTYEGSEDQVRDDLQNLFDQIRTYINNSLVPATNAITGSDVSVTYGGDSVSLQDAVSGIEDDLDDVVLGQIPNGSLTAEKFAPGAFFTDISNGFTVTKQSGDSNKTSSVQVLYARQYAPLRLVMFGVTVALTIPANSSKWEEWVIGGTAPTQIGRLMLISGKVNGDANSVGMKVQEGNDNTVTVAEYTSDGYTPTTTETAFTCYVNFDAIYAY